MVFVAKDRRPIAQRDSHIRWGLAAQRKHLGGAPVRSKNLVAHSQLAMRLPPSGRQDRSGVCNLLPMPRRHEHHQTLDLTRDHLLQLGCQQLQVRRALVGRNHPNGVSQQALARSRGRQGVKILRAQSLPFFSSISAMRLAWSASYRCVTWAVTSVSTLSRHTLG